MRVRIKLDKNKNGSGSYSFSEDNYNAGLCGTGHNLTGDIPQGNSTYDAARVNIGSPWMMFTSNQGSELIDHTDHEWTTINGVNGRKFINKTDSLKYIFLPAGGDWYIATNNYAGIDGRYWSTDFYDSSEAWDMYIESSRAGFSHGGYRRSGFSIRPIANQKPW